MLRKNQIEAIENSIKNDFESGVHFQATGSGKSRIALEIILKFNEKNPRKNILWLCEKKSILISQFERKKIYEIGYDELYKKFIILNYSKDKRKDWYDIINSCSYWNKSILIIINRTFFTMNENYKNIKLPINLIIHDECHTIKNNSTQNFYNYIFSLNNKPKVIGLSATPPILKFPFNNILSSFSIYDGIKDKIIVPPIIKWINNVKKLTNEELLNIINKSIEKLYYKKIIIWCGMINECLKYATLFKNIFKNYKICIDTSKGDYNFLNYNEFEKIENNAFLFCANKHREGSDIKNLDGCIFLDFVQNRYYKTFVQCIGRVLRIDKEQNKKFGLIIDLNAKNETEIIERLNMYLNIPKNIFPWEICKDNDINTLYLNIEKKSNNIENPILYKKNHIISCFKKPIKENYRNRLQYELDMFESKQLIEYLMKAIDILNMTNNIPHITRGSCGSSLVCYLLGISHVDPIKYDIKFSRFLNKYRNTLPDIDFDFPYNKRDEVFFKIEKNWPNKMARISNHIYYRDKSASREVLRKFNNSFISKNDLPIIIKNLSKIDRQIFEYEKSLLNETFRGFSLHCGGIVYYPDGIPSDLILENDKKKRIINQISLNKYEISNFEIFKIDILSSRGLAQLYEALDFPPVIDFEKFYHDENVFNLLSNGNNIGITFAESPLIKKAFLKYKPNSILDIAKCLSIIRPGAKLARFNENDTINNIIYDDDAIYLIQKLINCDEDEADKIRRNFSKNNINFINDFKSKIDFSILENKLIFKQLKNLNKYSFCKAHALSYAQLIYALAFIKYYNPINFWKATLTHCHSMYRKWVHISEAFIYNIHPIFVNKSIYSLNHAKKMKEMSKKDQLLKYGYWIIDNGLFYPNCFCNFLSNDKIEFNAIIASKRSFYLNKLILYIGYDFGKYIDCFIDNPTYHKNIIGVSGNAILTDKDLNIYQIIDYKFF